MKSQEPQLAQARKDDHVNHALDQQSKLIPSQFDGVRFVHHSLNQTDYQNIDLSTQWAGHQHSLPFFINGMTGGSRFTKKFNTMLAHVAEQTGLTMASGSVSAGLKDPSVRDTFTTIRENNPKGFILANIGAHHTLEMAEAAINMLQANALQIHLNIPQEVVMPEGDRDFSMWLENIATIVRDLGVPVVVKEVGFGMSRETINLLIQAGVQTIDISGRGGTNFIQIENDRRDQLDFSSLGQWGQTTPEALIEAQEFISQAEILASGGIRHFTDSIKALALGAKATGISGLFLKQVDSHGVDATVKMVQDWQESLRHMMLLVGCQDLTQLQKAQIILPSDLVHWADWRGIDLSPLKNR